MCKTVKARFWPVVGGVHVVEALLPRRVPEIYGYLFSGFRVYGSGFRVVDGSGWGLGIDG